MGMCELLWAAEGVMSVMLHMDKGIPAVRTVSLLVYFPELELGCSWNGPSPHHIPLQSAWISWEQHWGRLCARENTDMAQEPSLHSRSFGVSCCWVSAHPCTSLCLLWLVTAAQLSLQAGVTADHGVTSERAEEHPPSTEPHSSPRSAPRPHVPHKAPQHHHSSQHPAAPLQGKRLVALRMKLLPEVGS